SANEFILRMSREEIGSYLGLKLETVSRSLSKFSQEGWIEVEHKYIKIIDAAALQRLIAGYENKNES
ncbi:MAG: helix-turn-helix domain-containing protein, partial [Neisseriaceae bacterium]|nr:helix-turn-helix domain-containing protein [Neisseriaceae bacterium]